MEEEKEAVQSVAEKQVEEVRLDCSDDRPKLFLRLTRCSSPVRCASSGSISRAWSVLHFPAPALITPDTDLYFATSSPIWELCRFRGSTRLSTCSRPVTKAKRSTSSLHCWTKSQRKGSWSRWPVGLGRLSSSSRRTFGLLLYSERAFHLVASVFHLVASVSTAPSLPAKSARIRHGSEPACSIVLLAMPRERSSLPLPLPVRSPMQAP